MLPTRLAKALVGTSVVTILVVLGGCGGSSSTSNSSDSYVANGTAACLEFAKQVPPIPSTSDVAAFSPYLDQAVPVMQRFASKMRALVPPADRQSAYDKLISTLNTVVAGESKARSVAKSDPKQAIAILSAMRGPSRINAEAVAAGLPHCGATPSS